VSPKRAVLPPPPPTTTTWWKEHLCPWKQD
jgi:hypothetical protein